MAEFPTTARVVIIGGGAVGASALYHLALAGWTDCVLLEKNELTAGSTWHAAGNVPTFSTSWAIMNMQRYSTELYRGLAEKVDYPMNYHVTGSIRLAHSKERVQEFERAKGMGRYQGMDIEMMSPKEAQEIYPFMELHDLKGVLYDPNDGDIDPSQLTQALAKGARDLGARIERFCPATGVSRDGDEWIVHTDKGDIRCEYVVNAAGYYAQKVGEWFKPYGGRTVPMMVMSHQYLLTDEIPEIANIDRRPWQAATAARCGFFLLPAAGKERPEPWPVRAELQGALDHAGRSDARRFQLSALSRRSGAAGMVYRRRNGAGAAAGQHRYQQGDQRPDPLRTRWLAAAGPDAGCAECVRGVRVYLWHRPAGGAGKVLAEWITEGATEWDMWAVDPRRYTDYTDADYCIQKGMETYGHEYAMHFPWHAWPAGRDKKLSPVHDKVIAAGGVMGAYNGWERANWFAQPGDDTSLDATHTWERAGPWEQRIREECEAVRDSVGVLDLPGFSRFNLSGEGAAEWLRGMITGGLPKIGRMNLAYFADDRGRILTEMSVLRHGEDTFTLITAATAQWHDFDVLNAALPAGLSLTDHTTEFSTLIVTGPKARALFEQIAEADLSLGWLSHQRAKVAGKNAALARVSFAGELGWEIHAANADMPAIYDAVIAAGAKPFGMWALNSLRIEKGYRAWKGDLSTDYTLFEGGLDRFVKLDKPQDFRGKAALQNEKQQGSKKRFVTLLVDAGAADAPYMSTLWHDGQVVGETTSGAWGYRINGSVALGMVRTDLAVPDTRLEVEIYGERRPATVQADAPLWDAENERLRA